jgi:predicted amidohydrolase
MKLNVSVYQGGHSIGVDNNLALLEEVVNALPEATDLIVFPELFIGGWGAGTQLPQLAQFKHDVVARVSPIAARRKVCLCFCLPLRYLSENRQVNL